MVREERGVTLVEIIIALAIAGILASTVLFGRDQLRARQQFSQGVDQIVQALSAARQEATGTVGRINFSVGGTDKDQYIYAKLVTLTNNSSNFKVETETIDRVSDNVKQIVNPYTIVIPWGVRPTGGSTSQYFLFTIQNGGGITTYYSSVDADKPTAGPPASAKNGSMTAISDLGGSKTFNVQSTSGSMTATITVDQYGNVSRVIN